MEFPMLSYERGIRQSTIGSRRVLNRTNEFIMDWLNLKWKATKEVSDNQILGAVVGRKELLNFYWTDEIPNDNQRKLYPTIYYWKPSCHELNAGINTGVKEIAMISDERVIRQSTTASLRLRYRSIMMKHHWKRRCC